MISQIVFHPQEVIQFLLLDTDEYLEKISVLTRRQVTELHDSTKM